MGCAYLEEVCDDALDRTSLPPVEEGGARGTDLLGARLDVEEVGLGGHGPGEVDGSVEALVLRDTVLQRALVEHVGREGRQARVHAVLHLNRGKAEQGHREREGQMEGGWAW